MLRKYPDTMSLKAKLEAIIYATEEPVTLNELATLLRDAVLADLRAEAERAAEQPETPVTAEAAPEEASGQLPTEPAQTPARKPDKQSEDKEQPKAVKARINAVIDELIADYASPERGIEIRQVAGGYRMATKPEHHDVVVSFAKSLKPPVRLSLQALETLSVIAYKQPVTVPEISEIRGVDTSGVIATLLDRKLITTAGRKQVIGRPILYKTTKEFLMRFGLNDISELPSMEEFEKLGEPQADLFSAASSETPVEDEPVTEAVPEAGSHLVGESNEPAEGSFETEAQPGLSQEKS